MGDGKNGNVGHARIPSQARGSPTLCLRPPLMVQPLGELSWPFLQDVTSCAWSSHTPHTHHLLLVLLLCTASLQTSIFRRHIEGNALQTSDLALEPHWSVGAPGRSPDLQ